MRSLDELHERDERAGRRLPRIFDLFVQSERTLDRAQGGLGIGLSVVKRLVEMLQEVRLIAVTGYGQTEGRQQTQAAGFDGHLVKPVDLALSSVR